METTPNATVPDDRITADATVLDRAAFDRTAPARAALMVENTPQYHLDGFFAAGRALWIVPRITAYRPRVLLLPEFDIQQFDALEDLARGLRFVQTEILRRIQRSRQIPGIASEGWRMRSLMMSYAEALSYKRLIAPELLVRLREGSGYRDLVEDLNVLVQELLGLAPEMTGLHSPVTKADLTRASEIAHELNLHVGNAADADLSQATLLEERRKLATLLLASHGQVRRAIGYLRWKEGDVGTLVPSLHVPPGARKTSGVTTEVDVVVPEDIAALHAQLHDQQEAASPLVHPEDHPFAAE